MASLSYFRKTETSAGDGFADQIYITNLGHAKLRVINVQCVEDVARISVEIISKGASHDRTKPTTETISLMHNITQNAIETDIGWEGDIDLAADQDLRVTFLNVTAGVLFAAAKTLIATVGFEYLG